MSGGRRTRGRHGRQARRRSHLSRRLLVLLLLVGVAFIALSAARTESNERETRSGSKPSAGQRRGLISVADAYNCRVLFINRAHSVVRELGRAGACAHAPPAELGAVNGATPLPGGGTLVNEIKGSWIDALAPSGRLLWDFRAPVSYPSDPQWLGHGHI